MAKDARTLRDEATAASAAGKHKRALAAYLELEGVEPRDAQWAKRAAETYRRLGKDRDAIVAYERAADRYAQNGFLVQAIAVCKLILQMDPTHADTLRRLATNNELVGAGPTRASTMADNNTSLHENAAVAALRTRATGVERAIGNTGAPPLGHDVDRETLPHIPVAMPRTRTATPTSGSVALPRTRTATPTSGSIPLSRTRTGSAVLTIGRTLTPPGRARSASTAPPMAVSRTRSSPITMHPGAALDTVQLASVMRGSYERDVSKPGVTVIPLDDDAIELEADELTELGDDASSVEISITRSGTVDLDAYDLPPRDPRDAIDPFAPPDPRDLDLDPPTTRPSLHVIELEPSNVHDVEPSEVDESTELEFGDIEEIPLPEPRAIGMAAQRALAATPLFAGLPQAALEALVEHLSLVSLDPGEVLFHEGDDGDALYVIAEGEVAVSAEGPPRVEMARLGPGAFIGEVALMTDQPRSATVTAVDFAELLRIDRTTLTTVLANHGDVLRAVLRFVRDRLVDRWTRTSPLFRPFDDAERAALANRFKFLEVDTGVVLLGPSHRPDGLYIVLAGTFDVTRNGATVATLGPGELIGETALLSGGQFKSEVVARGRGLALCLPASDFREIIMTHPHVLEYIGEHAEHSRRLQIL